MRGAIVSARMQEEENSGLLTLQEMDEKTTSIPTNTWAVLFLIGYLILGLLFFCYSSSHLSALDAIYLSIITFTTVGYGDVTVKNKIFGAFYVLLGAGIVAAFFGIFSNDVMEAQEAVMQERFVKVANAMTEVINNTARKVKSYQREKLKVYYDEINHQEPDTLSTFARAKQKLYKFILTQIAEDDETMQNLNLRVYEEQLRELRSKGLVDGLFVFVALFSGALCMMRLEGWTFDRAFYWAAVTVTTTGYGDVTPKSDSGKIFTIFYVIIACALAAKGFSDIVRYPLILRAKRNELWIAQQFGSELSEKTLQSILKNDFFTRIPSLRRDLTKLNKSEFVLLMLNMMNKVQEKDILLACQIFDRLDVAQDGILDEEDQKEQILRARQRDLERSVLEQAKREEEEKERQRTQILGNLGANLGANISANIANVGNMLGSALHGGGVGRNRSASQASNPNSRRKSSARSPQPGHGTRRSTAATTKSGAPKTEADDLLLDVGSEEGSQQSLLTPPRRTGGASSVPAPVHASPSTSQRKARRGQDQQGDASPMHSDEATFDYEDVEMMASASLSPSGRGVALNPMFLAHQQAQQAHRQQTLQQQQPHATSSVLRRPAAPHPPTSVSAAVSPAGASSRSPAQQQQRQQPSTATAIDPAARRPSREDDDEDDDVLDLV